MGKNNVSISEKVRFWEEQDSINQALIPRVLKNHELILEVSQSLRKIGGELAEVEGRILSMLDSKAKELALRNTEILEKRSQELATQFKDELRDQEIALRTEVTDSLEKRAENIRQSINDHLARELAILSSQTEKMHHDLAKRVRVLSWIASSSLAIALLGLSLHWIGGR